MIQLRVYGEDGCEPKEEELMYIVHLVVVVSVFFGTVANVVEGERVEMTKQCLHYIAVHQIKTPRTAMKSKGYQVFSLCPY